MFLCFLNSKCIQSHLWCWTSCSIYFSSSHCCLVNFVARCTDCSYPFNNFFKQNLPSNNSTRFCSPASDIFSLQHSVQGVAEKRAVSPVNELSAHVQCFGGCWRRLCRVRKTLSPYSLAGIFHSLCHSL